MHSLLVGSQIPADVQSHPRADSLLLSTGATGEKAGDEEVAA
jgi:hypothetical protein